jgi:hypothetical protein
MPGGLVQADRSVLFHRLPGRSGRTDGLQGVGGTNRHVDAISYTTQEIGHLGDERLAVAGDE